MSLKRRTRYVYSRDECASICFTDIKRTVFKSQSEISKHLCHSFTKPLFCIFQTNTRLQNTVGSIRAGILDRRQSILNISTQFYDSAADHYMGFYWYVIHLRYWIYIYIKVHNTFSDERLLKTEIIKFIFVHTNL